MDQIMQNVRVVVEACEKAEQGDYDTAIEILTTHDGNFEAKTRLLDVLKSKDEYYIRRVFDEYKLRMSNALCDSCWEAIHG